MAILVGGVHEVETTQKRIGGQLRGAKDVASSVRLGLAETEESLRSPRGVAPDPALKVCQHFARLGMHMSGRAAERTTEITIAALGLALIASAAAANQQWFDRHFLPDFFVPRARIVQVETNVRIATVAAGSILLLLCRRPLARFLVRDRIGALVVALAIAASFCAAELVLRQSHLRAKEEVSPRNEPRRHLDAQLGWLFVPSRSGYQTVHGRRIEYAFDRNGYRVRRVEESIDFERPTILFTGESMMVGEKLQWDETFAAQTARLMNLQAAHLAGYGFASDQA